MKRLLAPLALVVVGVAVAVPALAAPAAKSGAIVIRHEQRGCHTWSLNGGRYKVMLETRLDRGGSLTITNIDPMVHKLIQQSGPRVGMRTIPHDHMRMMGLHRIAGRGVMNHMGAAVSIGFSRAGVYRFTTEDLGDYLELKTVGEHNHLMLLVRVK